jgi:serine/threonine protein phosphatase PrpC
MRLVFYDGSIQGRREEQQDDKTNLRLKNGYHLCVLADGMGGAAGGRLAGKTVCTAFRKYFSELQEVSQPHDQLYMALLAANRQILEATRRTPELAGMGATVIALLIHVESGQFYFVSVGDSPLYQFRQGVLIRINDSHAFAEDLKKQVAQGVITAAEAAAHPSRHAVTSVVTGSEIPLIDRKDGLLVPGELLLMASDGLLTLDDGANGSIAHILGASGGDPEKAVFTLLQSVEAAGNPEQDNTTLVMLGLEAEEDKAAPAASSASADPPKTMIRANLAPASAKQRGRRLSVLIALCLLAMAALGLFVFLKAGESPKHRPAAPEHEQREAEPAPQVAAPIPGTDLQPGPHEAQEPAKPETTPPKDAVLTAPRAGESGNASRAPQLPAAEPRAADGQEKPDLPLPSGTDADAASGRIAPVKTLPDQQRDSKKQGKIPQRQQRGATQKAE